MTRLYGQRVWPVLCRLPIFSSLAVQVQGLLEEAGPSDVGTTSGFLHDKMKWMCLKMGYEGTT